MGNYIQRVKISGVKKDNLIELSNPIGKKYSTIDIVSGENNTGKTYILKQLFKLVRKMSVVKEDSLSEADFGITMTNNSEVPRILYFGKTWVDKEGLGEINLTSKDYKVAPNLEADKTNYAHNLINLVYDSLSYKDPLGKISFEDWIKQGKERLETVEWIRKGGTAYKLSSKVPFVNIIENILDRKLYFRRIDNKLELIGVSDDREVLYKSWSQGDKALFYLVLMLYYEKPDIILIDEIEANLHPKYITSVMKIIKKLEAQTIITTHSPHVIFSELVDQVFYIELEKAVNEVKVPEDEIQFAKVTSQNPPKRKIITLTNDYEKIEKVYDLFDITDSRLLNQANLIRTKADVDFYKYILEMFSPGVVQAGNSVIPDRQTKQLSESLYSIFENNDPNANVNIIEFGAGLGRLPKEMMKITSLSVSKKIEWHCWEPNEKNRTELRDKCKDIDFIKVVNSEDEIANNNYELAIIANVIHELSPSVFAELVYKASTKIKGRKGAIVILEIFPLLYPEKMSIAYPETYMKKILINSGFVCSSINFKVRDSSAYCVVASPYKEDITQTKIENNIFEVLKEIKLELLSGYFMKKTMKSMRDYKDTINEMSTLACIELAINGIWNED